MSVLLYNNELELLSRRDILKYSGIAGIAMVAGANILSNVESQLLPNINISDKKVRIDYSMENYNVAIFGSDMSHLKSLLSDNRVSTIYMYGKEAVEHSKVKHYNSLSSFILSLGAVIPHDYDIDSIDMQSYKEKEALLYLSSVYEKLQHSNKAVLNEEKILSSIEILGRYNKHIYISQNSIYRKEYIVHTVEPIGNIVVY